MKIALVRSQARSGAECRPNGNGTPLRCVPDYERCSEEHSMSKLKLAGILIMVSIVGGSSVAQQASVSNADLTNFVNKRVQEWQPTKEEKRFDEIGWVKDIRTAERLAKEHGRPVFLFTQDGRMNTGRC
jgi:hypothetical protein